MKKKITIFLSVLLILVSLHKVTTSSVSERLDINTTNVSDSFIIGATDNAWQGNNDTLVNKLKHNVWHKYGTYPNGWRYQGAPNDSLYSDSSRYYPQVKSIINNNASENIMTTMDRGKISLLAWSQSSDYQCEETLEDNDYWFYSYNTHSNVNMQDLVDNSYHGNNERVRHCYPNPSSPESAQGWVVKDLKANREQINRDWWYELNDSVGAWYIKPRIRIDSAYANNPANLTKPVCRIDVLNFEGDTIKRIEIKVRNFKPDFDSIYSGKYLDEFYFITPSWTDTSTEVIQNGSLFNPDRKGLGDMSCKVDFRVWYYGNCEMWIDRIRVENEVAHYLMNKDTSDQTYKLYDKWLRWESNLAMENPDYIWNFYLEEFEFNNTKSIAYVNKKIKEYTTGRFSLMVNLNYELYKVHIPYSWTYYFSAEKLNKYLFEPAEIDTYWNVAYVLEGWSRTDSAAFGGIPNYHPNTLSNSDYNAATGIQSYKTTPSAYDDWLQVHLDQGPASVLYINQMKLADTLSKNYDKKVINLLQAHMWHQTTHKLKEPSNEELEMINMLPISYGVKGIIYFTYSSVGNIGEDFYYRGIIEPGKNPITPRYYNVYGQEKWNKLKEIGSKIKYWGPYLMSFDNLSRRSYIIRSEISKLTDSTYFNDILSYIPNPFDYSVPQSSAEPISQRYLQVAVFKNPTELYSKYFMVVNRRCSPYDSLNPGNTNGGRFVTIRLDADSTEFALFNSWKIIDLKDNSTVSTFDKRSISTNYLKWFLPGEGKLYKIAPVMQEGGILVANEEVGGEFDCKGEVYNNGKNITLKPGTTINFANSNARILMNGGNFKSGINTGDNTAPVNLQGKDTVWKGIVLQDCPSVEMYKTYFKDISPYEMDSTYAVDLVNCLYSKIDGCSFLADTDLNTGGIRANYTFTGEFPVDAYFLNSNFQMSNENIPALSFISSGGITVPLIIDGNTFTSDEGNSANAIFLCNVSGGAMKNNTITDYKTSVFMLSSAMDFYNNVIDGSTDNSIGIKGASQSSLGLGSSGNYFTGGMNNISSEGSTGKCIYLYKSSFDLHKGENVFNLKNYTSNQAYHLSGTFPDYQPNTTLSAIQNCFRLSGVNNSEKQNVKWVNGDLIDFEFLDYSCEVSYESENIIIDLGNDIKDTIYYESGGSGGGMSNYESGIKNYELKNGGENVEIVSMKSLIDSININTRKRNYNQVITDCQEYLNNYLNDSSNTGDQSPGIISKLFLASSRLDAAGNKITELKTLLENLILNNPENESIIKSSIYYIQKCKVKLEDYESAMTGFQQIMDQNPYTYEALTASWDFSATYLLILNQNGSGGGESSY